MRLNEESLTGEVLSLVMTPGGRRMIMGAIPRLLSYAVMVAYERYLSYELGKRKRDIVSSLMTDYMVWTAGLMEESGPCEQEEAEDPEEPDYPDETA